ncbi:hypothetical protein [Faecalibaculum rodentium]|uniref:hypothetical protein n=1 Tax=Faecalibaculum rodentium TaxID=1702221 RepID=UPI0025B04949|nr:hypothetical protein [Faecalibaculum rodentium]
MKQSRSNTSTWLFVLLIFEMESVGDVSGTIGIEIELNIRFSDPTAYQWIKQSETVVRVTAFVTLFFLGVAQVMPGIAAGIGNFLLEHLGFLIDVPVFRK